MKKISALKIKRKNISAQNFTASQFFAVLNFNESQRALYQMNHSMTDALK